MKKCIIFGAGVYDSALPHINENDFIIAADAGYEKCRQLNIMPDLTVGDFDSSTNIPITPNVVTLPIEKDITDLDAAINYGIKENCNEFHIYGGLGGRIDHSFANYSLIARLAKEGKKAFLYGENYKVCALHNADIEIEAKKGTTLSVFSWSEFSSGVSISGVKYPLENAVLTKDFSLGVSNSFVGKTAKIGVKNGTLLIMLQHC